MQGGKPIPLPLPAKFEALTFSENEKALFISNVQERPARIRRMDLMTGEITMWKELRSENDFFLIRRP